MIHVPKVSTKIFSSPAFPKILSTTKSPRKRILQQKKTANELISIFNNLIEKKCSLGNTSMRFGDQIMLCKQITKELRIQKVRECIRIDHELHVNLYLQGSLDHFHSGFGEDIISS